MHIIKKTLLMLMSAILVFQLFAPMDQAFAQSQGSGTILSASIASLQQFFIKMPLLLVLGLIVVTMYFMVTNHNKKKHHRFEKFGNIWEIQEL